jgi:hypothetical protein
MSDGAQMTAGPLPAGSTSSADWPALSRPPARSSKKRRRRRQAAKAAAPVTQTAPQRMGQAAEIGENDDA